MQLTLQIAPTTKKQREIAAWFVTGSNPDQWVSQLTWWNLPLESLVLHPIPTAFDNQQPLGVLVTVRSGAVPPNVTDSPLVLPYGCIGHRLYLPIEAKIVPIVTEKELIGLLPADKSDFIWHPSVGLVRCELTEQLSVLDLVRAPASISSNWDRAVPGIAIRNRLISIEPTDIQTADEIFRIAGEDIGTQRESIGRLPPAPGEGIAGQLHQWTAPLRKAWKSLWKRPPAKPPGSATGSQSPAGQSAGPSWLAWLGAAAAAPFAAMGGMAAKMIPKSLVDQTKRLREIDRLLRLLNDDPDAGLKFALPMGGLAAARGSGHSGNQLVGRDTSFGLGKLFSSGPVDPWDIPPAQQLLLMQRYRELAAREIQMGRHRRAAYIFAELLGDLQAAANTLEAGQHYREAAVLYRERLKRPLDAARCLERGGLLDEAAELYIEQGMMENAADLYYRLERPDEAERLLRNWAAQLIHQGHHLQASSILHEKLKDLDEALLVLDQGWTKSSSESESCLRQTFQLLGQHARHDNAKQRIATLREASFSPHMAANAARAISGVATGYADRAVQLDAADATQVIVARHLPRIAKTETAPLLNALRSLAPQDRLLGRDCDRFVRKQVAEVPQTPVRRKLGILHLQKHDLGSGVEWRLAKSNSETLYAAGYFGGGLLLRRVAWQSTWASSYQDIHWGGITNDHRVLLEIPKGKSHQVMVHAVGHDPLGVKSFVDQPSPTERDTAGSPIWAGRAVVAFTCDAQGMSWRVHENEGVLWASSFGATSGPLNNAMFQLDFTKLDVQDIPIAITCSNDLRIGVNHFLCQPQLEESQNDRILTLDAEIESLHSHEHSGAHCVVALFDAGAVMIREPIQRNSPQPFANGIEAPRGLFLTDGTFIVAGRKECRAYRFEGISIDQIGEVSLSSPTVAVTRTNHLGQFAILGEDGSVNLYALNQ